jgi:hypothetical protein
LMIWLASRRAQLPGIMNYRLGKCQESIIMTHYYLFVVVALWSYFVTNQWCVSFNIFFLAGYSNESKNNGRCGQALSTALKLTPRKQNRSRQHSCRWKSQRDGSCLQHELPCHQLQSKYRTNLVSKSNRFICSNDELKNNTYVRTAFLVTDKTS